MFFSMHFPESVLIVSYEDISFVSSVGSIGNGATRFLQFGEDPT